jgi:hypothetical protein
MISGQKVRFTMGGRTYDAVVSYGSDNRRSLVLCFDGAARSSDGGCYIGMIPVLLDIDERWKDLRGEEIALEWLSE